MKKLSFFLIFLFTGFVSLGQTRAREFEAVLRTGNSTKAFEFVRSYFGLAAREDPFLHFKERGIKQLVSFCDYRMRRIEATSLIRFSQVKEFWKNYSEQFTAGKWNYRSIYHNDSLAWLAANYSITLIYVHELGHYMSLRFTHNTTDTYTCEELLANECLAAFANSFNGDKKMDSFKKLFLKLAIQTAQFTPDSNKTSFDVPVKKWCNADPMKAYLDLYGTDDKEFLRYYGYTQFRMMEYTLTHYTGESWFSFLQRKFYRHFNQFTGKTSFQPLKYSVLFEEKQPENGISVPWIDIRSSGADSNSYFSYVNWDSFIPVVNPKGELFKCFTSKQAIPETDGSINDFYIINLKRNGDSTAYIEGWVFVDSTDEVRPEILAAWENKGAFHYLVKQNLWSDSTLIHQYEYYTLFDDGGKRYSRRFTLPDSLTKNNAIHNEYRLAGTNMGFPVIIHNQLTQDLKQKISFYMIDTVNNSLGIEIWNSSSEEKKFFSIHTPNIFIDTVGQSINLAFTNPVTEKIYLIKTGNSNSENFELLNQRANALSGQQMIVGGLCFADARKLYVLAKVPQPGKQPEKQTKKLLIKW